MTKDKTTQKVSKANPKLLLFAVIISAVSLAFIVAFMIRPSVMQTLEQNISNTSSESTTINELARTDESLIDSESIESPKLPIIEDFTTNSSTSASSVGEIVPSIEQNSGLSMDIPSVTPASPNASLKDELNAYLNSIDSDRYTISDRDLEI